MKPLIKAKFVAALRSKKYKQGFGRLKTQDGCFCVLGVLCDVYAKSRKKRGIGFRNNDHGNVFHSGPGVFGWTVATPTNAVLKWAGLKHADPYISVGEEKTSLMQLNDRCQMPFSELADLIEAQL